MASERAKSLPLTHWKLFAAMTMAVVDSNSIVVQDFACLLCGFGPITDKDPNECITVLP